MFGVYGGFLGLEHGVGEIMQGNAAMTSVQINAYAPPGLPFPFGREPTMTLLPTLLLAGILAVLTDLTVMIWSAFFIQMKHSILILYLMSILLLRRWRVCASLRIGIGWPCWFGDKVLLQTLAEGTRWVSSISRSNVALVDRCYIPDNTRCFRFVGLPRWYKGSFVQSRNCYRTRYGDWAVSVMLHPVVDYRRCGA